MKNIRGFTFVELMVTLAIISVLSVIILPSFRQAQANSRDAKRKGDLKRMQTALENYYEDNRGYPISSSTAMVYYSSETGDFGMTNGPLNNGQWIPGLAPKYISSLPQDPLRRKNSWCTPANGINSAFKGGYFYISTGVDYKLGSYCTMEGATTVTDSFYDPTRPNHGWMVCNGDTTACNTW